MKDHKSNKDIINDIMPVIENTAMRYGLIPLEVLFEKENDNRILRIYIWSAHHRVSHKDCENMSYGLGDLLDELIPFKYYLEISSPGLDKQLKSPKEFLIFKGHDIILKLKNLQEDIKENKIGAKISEYFEGKGLEIEYNDKKYVIKPENIASVRLNDAIEINKNKNKGEEND